LRRVQLNTLALFILAINSLGGLAQVFIWQEIVWFPLLLALSPAVIFITQSGFPQKFRWLSFLYGIAIAFAIIFLERALPYDRMRVADSLSQMAALASYLMVTTAMFVLILINSVIKLRTISARLVTIFTFVAFLSALATLVISALASLYYDRQNAFQELNAISAMKTSQILSTLSTLEQEANFTLADQLNDQRINFLLSNQPGTILYEVNTELVRAFLIRQKNQNPKYEELLLLDATGKALISTNQSNQVRDFSTASFFKTALNNVNTALNGINSTFEYDFPGTVDKTSIMVVKPFVANGVLRGAIVARVSFNPIEQIMLAKIGVGETAESYLISDVAGKFIPSTVTRISATEVNTRAAQATLVQNITAGSEI